MRRELWFGTAVMAMIIIGTLFFLPPISQMTTGHLGLLMLSLVVVAIMLGFPTAFTLMGMGVIFAFFAYYSRDPGRALELTLTLMVQRAYSVMTNEVLISIPLFVFMGYLIERANLIEKLFKSLHLALARVPGSLAVATLFTCAVFATATGIVGAVVTLMGLLAMPAMLKAGYNVKLSAGVITAGGCLGILIPPSVMLIVYGATAGVPVTKLYAGAFFPGIMLAGLYIIYVIIVAMIKPHFAPPLSEKDRHIEVPSLSQRLRNALNRDGDASQMRALPALAKSIGGTQDVPAGYVRKQLLVTLLPAIGFLLLMLVMWNSSTKPAPIVDAATAMQEIGAANNTSGDLSGGLAEPGVNEPPGTVSEPPSSVSEPPGAAKSEIKTDTAKAPNASAKVADQTQTKNPRKPIPGWIWGFAGVGAIGLAVLYGLMTFERLQVFKMLLSSFFPLAFMIIAVLGTIVFGLATPTEAAAVGSFGGFGLAAIYFLINNGGERTKQIALMWSPFLALFLVVFLWLVLLKMEFITTPIPDALGMLTIFGIFVWALMAYKQVNMNQPVKESVFLTAKTSAMVCWLFVGSAIFSAAFALLGGQDIVERWVLSLGLTKVQFLLLSQLIIFILGWPLEWTEIIVIFMPIFIPLLDKFGVDPLFFGLLVALNLQTAFLSPPVAMAAFYLKGVAPPHVTLNQIFLGMIPFMGIQVFALFLLYMFPEIGMWLPAWIDSKQ